MQIKNKGNNRKVVEAGTMELIKETVAELKKESLELIKETVAAATILKDSPLFKMLKDKVVTTVEEMSFDEIKSHLL